MNGDVPVSLNTAEQQVSTVSNVLWIIDCIPYVIGNILDKLILL